MYEISDENKENKVKLQHQQLETETNNQLLVDMVKRMEELEKTISDLRKQMNHRPNYRGIEEQKEKAKTFLSKWHNVFSHGPFDLGHTQTEKHDIHLNDEKPFKEPYRHIPPSLIQEVREHLKEMMQMGAIMESSSSFSSNVVLVRKKDCSIRFCIDYRD